MGEGQRQCTACGGSFPATREFFQPMTNKYSGWIGLSAECRPCRRKRFRLFYADNREEQIARAIIDKRERRKDPDFRERDRTWSRESARRRFTDLAVRAEATARNRQWRADHPEACKEFTHQHPAMKAFRAMLRYARKRHATPRWADLDAIKEIYRKAHEITKLSGIEHEVDHIYRATSCQHK